MQLRREVPIIGIRFRSLAPCRREMGRLSFLRSDEIDGAIRPMSLNDGSGPVSEFCLWCVGG